MKWVTCHYNKNKIKSKKSKPCQCVRHYHSQASSFNCSTWRTLCHGVPSSIPRLITLTKTFHFKIIKNQSWQTIYV